MADATRIVGVSGFMRTGKDSVAALLQGFGYQRVSFADPLRKVARDIDPYISLEGASDEVLAALWPTGEDGTLECVLYSELFDTLGYETAKSIPDFRRYLQRLGTEGIRGNFGETAWVDMAKATIAALGDDAKVVMPDVRFPNEAEAVNEMGGTVWRTERPGFEPEPDAEGNIHPSEAMVYKITPDVTLAADSLLDWEETLVDEQGNAMTRLHVGLGSLVIQQLGLDVEDNRQTLADWADAVLNG